MANTHQDGYNNFFFKLQKITSVGKKVEKITLIHAEGTVKGCSCYAEHLSSFSKR